MKAFNQVRASIPFTRACPVGSITNWGVLTRFDEHGRAFFTDILTNGNVGSACYHLVRVYALPDFTGESPKECLAKWLAPKIEKILKAI
jgi:hypothetical protein